MRTTFDEIRRAFALLTVATRWRWAGLLPLAVSAAAAEATAALSVFALLRVIADPGTVDRLALTPFVKRWRPFGDPHAEVMTFAAVLLIVYAARNALLAASAWARARMVYGSVAELSRRSYTAYLRAPLALSRGTNPAAMIERVQRTAEVVSTMVLAAVLNLVAEALLVAGLVLLLGTAASLMTLLAVSGTALLVLVPGVLTSPVFSRWGQGERRLQTDILQQLHEGLGGLKEVKLNERESFVEARFASLRQQLSAIQRKRDLLTEALRLGVETAFALVLVLVIVVMTRAVQGSDVVSLLGLYAYAGFRLIPSIHRITLNLSGLRYGLPYAVDLAQELSTLSSMGADDFRDRHQMPAFSETIVLDGVTYTYAPDSPRAVDDVNLTITRGQSVGIMGPTGAGKSTLLDLLLGLIEPTSGRVLIDGEDVGAVARAWRRQIGYVSQTPYLLDDSLRQNIAFGLPGESIDQDRLRTAIMAAQLEAVVALLPQGLDTTIGDRGVRLSAGQRQRVAIARALYRDPAVLILDEATAALDQETEREMTRAIESLQGTRTMIVVAHRPSTLQSCDRIVVLRQGRVVAEGSYADLLTNDPHFQSLVGANEIARG